VRLVVIGAAASGKSTLTDLLVASHPGTSTFGVRRHFARQIELGTPAGLAVADVVKAQGWIPDRLVAAAVRSELITGGLTHDFILEGMPGNFRQAQLLDEVLQDFDIPLDAAVHVDTPLELCASRSRQRRVCSYCDGGSHQAEFDSLANCIRCGRPVTRRGTDSPEEFAQRLALYTQQAPPLLDFYRDSDRLIAVAGEASPHKVLGACLAQLAIRLSR